MLERQERIDQLATPAASDPVAALELRLLQKLPEPGLRFVLPQENNLIFPQGLGFCLMGVLVLLGVSSVFSDEYATGMDALLLSAKRGRRHAVRAKALASAIYCAFAAIFVLAVNFACQAATVGLHGLSAPLQLGATFANSPFALTIGGALLIEALASAVACAFFGMLVLLVSSLSKNVLIPFFSCGSLFALAALIKSTFAHTAPATLRAFGDYSYTELMRGAGLLDSLRESSPFGLSVPYALLLPAVLAVVTAAVVAATYRVFPAHPVK